MVSDHETAEIVYLDGRFLLLEEACISPLDRGFLYGDGIFTTMRAEQGHVLYLKEHLARLQHSMAELRLPLHFTVNWQETLPELLRRNCLENHVASIKIVVTRGPSPVLGLPNTGQSTVLIYARRYVPPPSSTYRRGYRLYVFRDGFSPPLSRLKSLNYLYYLMARQTALDAGADEAVILDFQGKVAETAAGSLLIRSDGNWWTPKSAYQLPSITLREVTKILEETGVKVARRSAHVDELFSAETIWVLNSLIGVMPASQLDQQPLPEPAPDEASRLRRGFFARGREETLCRWTH